MTNPNDAALNQFRIAERQLDRLDDVLARDIANTYRDVRVRLLEQINARRALLGISDDVQVLQALARDVALLQAIEAELAALQTALNTIFVEQLSNADALAVQAVLKEVRGYATAYGLRLPEAQVFSLFDRNAVLMIQDAIDYLPILTRSTGQAIIAELRSAIISGEGFPKVIDRLFAVDNSVWTRGRNSASLYARRTLIDVFNESKQESYGEIQREYLPTLQKQAVAAISNRTTERCLAVHAQIRDIDKPFDLIGDYSGFGNQRMHSPFHWNCRTSIAPYMKEFEVGASPETRTETLRTAARAAA